MTEEEFTGFKRKHYRIASGACWDACNAYRAARGSVCGAHQDFAKRHGGIGVFPGSHERIGNATAISAVIFEGSLPSGWKSRRQANFRGLKRNQTAAWPDRRTTAGKEALKEIAALPLLPDPDKVCEQIGFPTWLQYEGDKGRGTEALGFFDTINIGWLEDTFYVALPDIAGQRARRIADGYVVTTPEWAPIEGMELILKEEMQLDYARAAAAKAIAA